MLHISTDDENDPFYIAWMNHAKARGLIPMESISAEERIKEVWIPQHWLQHFANPDVLDKKTAHDPFSYPKSHPDSIRRYPEPTDRAYKIMKDAATEHLEKLLKDADKPGLHGTKFTLKIPDMSVTLQEQINELPSAERGKISDGYHTFDELYAHRIALYIALARSRDALAHLLSDADEAPSWKTKTHSDGSVWEGWFLLGTENVAGEQISYHLPDSYWEECSSIRTLDIAPPFDGHTSQQVLERLKNI